MRRLSRDYPWRCGCVASDFHVEREFRRYLECGIRIIETWHIEYNTERPHSSLGNLTPQEFAENGLAKEKESVSLPVDSNRNSDSIGVRSLKSYRCP